MGSHKASKKTAKKKLGLNHADSHVVVEAAPNMVKVTTKHVELERVRRAKNKIVQREREAKRKRQASNAPSVRAAREKWQERKEAEDRLTPALEAAQEHWQREASYLLAEHDQRPDLKRGFLERQKDDDDLALTVVNPDGTKMEVTNRQIRQCDRDTARVLTHRGKAFGALKLAKVADNAIVMLGFLAGAAKKDFYSEKKRVYEALKAGKSKPYLANRGEPLVMSKHQQKKLLMMIHSLDLTVLEEDGWEIVLLTLTLPGGTIGHKVAPTIVEMQELVKWFKDEYAEEIGKSLRGVAKHEWQARLSVDPTGAAGCWHLHCLTSAPRKGTKEWARFLKKLSKIWADLCAEKIGSQPGDKIYDDHLKSGVDLSHSKGYWSIGSAAFYLAKYLSFKDKGEDRESKQNQNAFPASFFEGTDYKQFEFAECWGLDEAERKWAFPIVWLDDVLEVLKALDYERRERLGDHEKTRTYERDVMGVDGLPVTDDDGVIQTQLVTIENNYFGSHRFKKTSASAWAAGITWDEVEQGLRDRLGDEVVDRYARMLRKNR